MKIKLNNKKYDINNNKDIEKLITKYRNKKFQNGETIYHILIRQVGQLSKDAINFVAFMALNDNKILERDNTGWSVLHYMGMLGVSAILTIKETYTTKDDNNITPYSLYAAFSGIERSYIQ